jgi:hypothetical protein
MPLCPTFRIDPEKLGREGEMKISLSGPSYNPMNNEQYHMGIHDKKINLIPGGEV